MVHFTGTDYLKKINITVTETLEEKYTLNVLLGINKGALNLIEQYCNSMHND